MRIGVDIRNLLKPQYSGVSEYTFQVLNQLIKSAPNDEFKLWYNSYKNLDKFIPNFEAQNVKRFPSHWPNKFLNLSLMLAGKPALDKLVNGCDIFWSPDINFSSFSKNTKNVITIHDLSQILFPEFFNTKGNLWYKLIRPAQKIKKAHHLIAVSECTKRDLISLFKVPEEKITVISEGILPQYVPIKNDSREATAVKDKYNLPPRFALFLGTLEPRKNITSIILGLNQLETKIPLVIAGRKGWKYKEIFEAAKNSNQQIKFLDYVDAQDKPALYSLADMLIWPSYYEGFGLPPLEAQACGTPVIVGANSSLIEVIGDSGLLVNADHPEEIAIAAEAFWNNPAMHEEYRQRGLNNSAKYSWERTAKETLDLFRHISS